MFLCFLHRKILNVESINNDVAVQEFLLQLTSQFIDWSSAMRRFDLFNVPIQLNCAAFCNVLEDLIKCPVTISVNFEGQNGINVGQYYFCNEKLKQIQQSFLSSSNMSEVYKKIRTVGKGAFGTAVLYERLIDNKLVVIKEINMTDLTAHERQMALNEVNVLSLLNHPNIISYMSSFESDGVLMIEMEYADGGTLAQLLSRRSTRLSEYDILVLFEQIVSAINYMHQHNILHRDLKTANVFLTKDNVIKVGDFGISKMLTTKGQAHTMLGTPYYISPEMCEGKEYGSKSDIWALGCILYEMACLQKTFEGTNLPVLVNKIMKSDFQPLPSGYSKDFRELVDSLLQKDPQQRPDAVDICEKVHSLLQNISMYRYNSDSQSGFKSVLYHLSGSGKDFSLVPVQLPPYSKVTQVAASSTHYVAVTSEMLVYTWGEGGRGQLGHDDTCNWCSYPTCVESLRGRSIIKIGAGDGFSVFVSDSGVIMTCGDGTFGSLGHGDFLRIIKPRLVEKLLSVDVVEMSCGEHHCAVISGEGELYTWGRGESGRLGHGNEQDCCLPTVVHLPKNDELLCVVCGIDSTAVITTKGAVYACGKNNNNKLGLSLTTLQSFIFMKDANVEKSLQFIEVKSLSKWHVINISMSNNHSSVLTDAGYVITMGSNNENQLGHNNVTPAVVKSTIDKIVTITKCGPTYTVVGTEENAIYFWGTRYTPSCSSAFDSSSTNSLASTNLKIDIVAEPEEILALYASPNQIAKGEIVTLYDLCPLWLGLLVLVDTTVPLPKLSTLTFVEGKQNNENNSSCSKNSLTDTSESVPSWIKAELAEANNSWRPDIYDVPSSLLNS
ncbi:serine/threonine-protein kinase Nek8-like [Lycorma delicatula]|uniref:serine/threonine-protein kinase Nek8-like n=1 Tax=Lycorma delicatula TaxID=130591 RepID=UPI003F514589